MNTKLTMQQENISKKTVALANNIKGAADDFINSFNQNDMFTFRSSSNSKRNLEEYLEKYYLFFSKISPMISELSSLNAKLASLLIEADKSMHVELIIVCENKFNAYEKFEHELYEYIKSLEDAFANSSASASLIINLTQRLKNSLTALIEINT